ncbi:MAG: hypothetical protein ACJ73D_13000, partial [Pyrinomonadaceae bacterium]
MRYLFLLSLVLLLISPAFAQTKRSEIGLPAEYRAISFQPSGDLSAAVDKAARDVIADKRIDPDQLAVTLIDVRDPQHP